METLVMNYNNAKTDLCIIGQKYDTDKSSQRLNITNERHCHAYTLFYDALFQNKRYDKLNIAELGILHGSSLHMWHDYFLNSNIYGFEYYEDLIHKFKTENKETMDRIQLMKMDVTSDETIKIPLFNLNVMFDIIIDDSTHQFDDQIRVIRNAYKYLKPGGILIIEDIFKSYNENDYLVKLTDILCYFQDYYFVEINHVNTNSFGWDNDKLFVLIKGNAEPIIQTKNKMTIITPSYRIDKLPRVRDSIDFNYVDEWFIIYDGSKIKENPNLFKDDIHKDKIKEFVCNDPGVFGNSQRNFALNKIKNDSETFLYFLDDDNIIHEGLYKLLNIANKNFFYTFNQSYRLKGNTLKIGQIDTAMLLISFSVCKYIRWYPHEYGSDGFYFYDCYNANLHRHIFVDNDLCYYNALKN